MKKAVALVLVLAFAFSLIPAALAGGVTYVYVRYDSNLHSEPSADSKKISFVRSGEKYELIGAETEGWYCIRLDRNTSGYVDAARCRLQSAPEDASVAAVVEPGDIVVFGTYEQDGDTANGREPVEWLVLSSDNGMHHALVISLYGLDRRPYDSKKKNKWEDSSLRAWLNGLFYRETFTYSQRKAIIEIRVDNSKDQGYPKYGKSGGNNTNDSIFLLSYHQAWTYFPDDDSRKCTLTNYALSRGNHSKNQTEECYWLLRSPDESSNMVCEVSKKGGFCRGNVSRAEAAVRPALWLDLTMDVFEVLPRAASEPGVVTAENR